jgi:hypothetical protein
MNVFVGESTDAVTGRQWLKTMLQNEVVEVTFTKKDGTERVMRCTLQEDFIPAFQIESVSQETKKKSGDALAVWDVEASGWRSFRWDSIKSVSFNIT